MTTNEIDTAFRERCERIRHGLLEGLDGYYSDRDEWAECTDLLDLAGHYGQAVKTWFDAMLMLNEPRMDYGREFLLHPPERPVDEASYNWTSPHLLHDFMRNRLAVTLVLEGHVSRELARAALDYHNAYLDGLQYTSLDEALEDLGGASDALFSKLCPPVIAAAMIGETTAAFEKLGPDARSPDPIWNLTWEFLHALRGNVDNLDLDAQWVAIVSEWRRHKAKMLTALFGHTDLVLLCYLYCDATQKEFDLDVLGAQFRNEVMH